jgi:hypothetical protein
MHIRRLPQLAIALVFILVSAIAGTALADPGAGNNNEAENEGGATLVVQSAVAQDVSPPLGSIGSAPQAPGMIPVEPVFLLPSAANFPPNRQVDPAAQQAAGPLVATSAGLSFAGVGNGDYGFAPNAAPPDTNGAVGATQYVQWVNESFAIFNKSTGAILPGYPKAGNTLWAGFGGGCQTNNDGDPIVQYDKAAGRWIMTQFSVATTPFTQCVAVSTTSDANGTYNRYAFTYTNFNDYPKMGVWSDGYYITYNMFNAAGTAFLGTQACAFDRANMLLGQPATQVCFQLSPSFGGLLPSDIDGATQPPAGSPNYLVNFGTNSLNVWKFKPNFATPASSTFTGPTSIAVAAFNPACKGGTCIRQPGTTTRLDSLADRLMYRLSYRNRAGIESLVVNHSVAGPSNTSAIRWYELRVANQSVSVAQQGTFAPDAAYRWMGSIAMDKVGDIAVGYNVSSTTIRPSIRYSGRTPADPINTLQAETVLKAGVGSQTANLTRWGDYSAMTVDPTDDCTFWYTTEYLKANGSFNWSTWISSFKFPGCV